MGFECVRCHKKYVNKIDVERHLNIKNKCKPLKKNYILNNEQTLNLSLIKLDDRRYFLNEIMINEDDVICIFCYNFYNNKKLLNSHMSICKLKNCNNEYKKLFTILKDINDENLNIIRATEIKNIDDDFDISHFTDLERYSIINEPSPTNIIKYLYINKKNINILPLSDAVSCIVYNNSIKKMDNDLIYKILLKKIRSIFDIIFEKMCFEKKINHNFHRVIYDHIDVSYRYNHKDDLFKTINNILKTIQIENLFFFSGIDNVHFLSIDKLKIYCMNEKIDFIEQILGYSIDLVKKNNSGTHYVYKRDEKNGELYISEYYKSEEDYINRYEDGFGDLWKPVTINNYAKYIFEQNK